GAQGRPPRPRRGAGLGMNMVRRCTLALLALGLSACAGIEPVEPPALDLSGGWAEPADHEVPLRQAWWRGFQSPQLERLVATSLLDSPDLAAAAERVTQAELQVRASGASLFPSLSLGGS